MRNTFRKYLIATTIAVGLVAAPALADTWSGAYDNTIVSTYDDGHVVDVFVEEDHSYTIVPRAGGETISGTWADNGNKSCFTILEPKKYAGGDPLCFPLRDYAIGDTFEGTDSTGHFKAVIVKGRN